MTKIKKPGNPNPSPETRFGGPRSNPMGKTKRQKELEYQNGTMATEARYKMLSALVNVLDEKSASEIAAILSGGDILKLLKDSEDRAFGGPKASVDVSNDDGSLKPEPVQIAVMNALKKAHDA